jgi:hypothetical protein
MLRLGGLRLRVIAQGQSEPRPQFSIRSLLIVTTLVAAAVGLLEGLRPILSDNTDQLGGMGRFILDTVEDVLRPTTIRTLVVMGSLAGAALEGIWMVLRPGAIWLRLASLVVFVPTAAWYLTHLAGTGNETFASSVLDLAVALAAVTASTATTVLPLRLMGFRLMRSALGSPTLRVGQAAESRPQLRAASPHNRVSTLPLAHTECGPTLP